MKKTHSFTYQAHYSLSHEPKGSEKLVFVCFHGYGQLAEFFIQKFLPFSSEEVLIVAPEGTNYQYLKEFTGRIGANWMTRHERELAIVNNHMFLDSLLADILDRFDQQPKIAVLGFSQGAATATRWAAVWSKKVDYLILWAGVFAHDLKVHEAKSSFEKTQIFSVFGDQDEFVTPEVVEKQREFLDILGKKAEEHQFSGGHEIPAQILETLMTKII
ncbi:alpha/beta hydrolase [Algoriphagus namhaensis]|uniref:Alpha/beta hydrolase n=1 Tax=Algoriphagus namhaensis TaxID=915353 RepID=A0ABV8AMR8_9BACT